MTWPGCYHALRVRFNSSLSLTPIGQPPILAGLMRLYSGKIPAIAQEIIRTLTQAEDIEVGDEGEAQLDVEAVLKEYLRTEREITDKTKDLLESRGLPYEQF